MLDIVPQRNIVCPNFLLGGVKTINYITFKRFRRSDYDITTFFIKCQRIFWTNFLLYLKMSTIRHHNGQDHSLKTNQHFIQQSPNLYQSGLRFESQPKRLLFWDFSSYFSVSPGKCSDNSSILPLRFTSKLFQIYQSSDCSMRYIIQHHQTIQKKIDFVVSSSKKFSNTSCFFYDNVGRTDVYCFLQKLFVLKCKSSVYGSLKKGL
jgi:hypothetical protein